MTLAPNERTRDIYEDIDAYQRPPQVPLMELSTDNVLRALHLKKDRLSQALLWLLYKPSGFARFYKELPEKLDEMLKTYDLRRASLQAPIISATLTLRDNPRAADPMDRAVTLILGAKRYYDQLHSGDLEPDRFRDMPLEMGQYPNLFSTSLTVEDRKSRIFKSTRTDQITVLLKGQIYLLQINSWDGDTVFQNIRAALHALVADCDEQADPQPPVGLVTNASQVVQVRGFDRMQQVPENRENLDKLKHSFLTLCLDLDERPENDCELFLNTHARHPENRWSWQSLQLVVTGNAKACAVCNFSAYLDGNSMMRGAAEICRNAAEVEIPVQQSSIDEFEVQHLTWRINPQLLQRARDDYKRIQDDQQATFIFENVHQHLFRELELDPVEVFVIALYKSAREHTNEPPVLHQFLTMSKYRYMDLTTAVVSTPEVRAFCDYMDQNHPESQQGLELLKQAIQSQKKTCHEERSAFPLSTLYSLFLMSKTGWAKTRAIIIFLIADLILRKTKRMRDMRRDIVISHPAIYPEISMVGRPGVRLPYVTYFALHYQIFRDRTIITMMPGLRWSVPNEKLMAELNANIQAIIEIVKNEKTKEPGT